MKKSEFLFDSLQAIAQSIGPELESLVGGEFNCYDDVISLYEGESRLADGNNNLLAKLKEFFQIGGAISLKLPIPHVIKGITYIQLVKDVRLQNQFCTQFLTLLLDQIVVDDHSGE